MLCFKPKQISSVTLVINSLAPLWQLSEPFLIPWQYFYADTVNWWVRQPTVALIWHNIIIMLTQFSSKVDLVCNHYQVNFYCHDIFDSANHFVRL